MGRAAAPFAALLVFTPTQSSLRIWVPGVPFPFESLRAPSKVLFPLTHSGTGTPDTRPLLGSLLLKAQPEHRGLQAPSKVTGNSPLRGIETPLQPVLNPPGGWEEPASFRSGALAQGERGRWWGVRFQPPCSL